MINKTHDIFKQWNKDLTRSIAPLHYYYCLLAYRQGRTVGGLHEKKTAVLLSTPDRLRHATLSLHFDTFAVEKMSKY